MIEVVAPGPLATVQDLGRTGLLRFGVTLGGALDQAALTLGNRLVGNPSSAACPPPTSSIASAAWRAAATTCSSGPTATPSCGCGSPGCCAVQAENETVVFAWIVYESREHRDQVNEKVMQDPRLKMSAEDMPFDGKRMIYGGFKAFVEL